MKKKNNLNNILEEIVNQYFGDFGLEKTETKETIIEKPIMETKKPKQKEIIETRNKEDEKELSKEDHQLMLESLKEDFFTMLNTTKKIEEKKDLSDELENIAKTFFN